MVTRGLGRRGPGGSALKLSSVLRLLARQCADAQQRCNEMLASAGAERSATVDDPLVLGLLQPVNLRAVSTTMDVRFVVASSQRVGFALRILPLNLGFAAMHGIRDEQSSRLRFEVEAVPMPSPGNNIPSPIDPPPEQ